MLLGAGLITVGAMGIFLCASSLRGCSSGMWPSAAVFWIKEDEGRLVEDGTYASLLTQDGLFTRLHALATSRLLPGDGAE